MKIELILAPVVRRKSKEETSEKEIKREFFYAFLRNRLPAEASDFPLFMGK